MECDHAQCAKLLIEYQANTNIQDKEGNAALHFAARIGNEGMLLTLLEPEATDIDLQNKVSVYIHTVQKSVCSSWLTVLVWE